MSADWIARRCPLRVLGVEHFPDSSLALVVRAPIDERHTDARIQHRGEFGRCHARLLGKLALKVGDQALRVLTVFLTMSVTGTAGIGLAVVGFSAVLEVIAIVVAVAGTGVAAWSALSSRQAARSSQEQVKLAETQVQNAHRPVLVPVHGNFKVPFRGGEIHAHAPDHVENPVDRDDLPRYSAVMLPVENIGSGPALNVHGWCRAPRGEGWTQYHTGGIAAGGQDVVTFESDEQSLGFTGDDHGLEFEVQYEDVTGKPYRTLMHFTIGGNAYEVEHVEAK